MFDTSMNTISNPFVHKAYCNTLIQTSNWSAIREKMQGKWKHDTRGVQIEIQFFKYPYFF